MITSTQRFRNAAFVFTCFALFSAYILPAHAELTPETTLLRVEVQDHGETVKVSIPMIILDSVYAAMPKEVHEACVQLDLTPEVIFKELSAMEGEDIVRVTGEDQIRVWFDTITSENQKDLNFVTVFVKEKEEGGDEIHVKVPKGLIKLAARVIKELDLVEQFIDLPPEVRHTLKKLSDKHAGADTKENAKISENSTSEEKK